MIKLTKLALASAGMFAVAMGGLSGEARATTVNGGSLLTIGDANQLETWLGIGDQGFTNIWSGLAGVATSSSFHTAVDGAGPTFSIFGISLGNGTTAKIGGYTALDWGGANGTNYQNDHTAFIFNLSTSEAQFTQHTAHSIYVDSGYFPVFGGGYDLFAGYGILGQCGAVASAGCDGSTRSYTYDQTQGQITVAGDIGNGSGAGNSGLPVEHWSVNSLEVFTFAPAAPTVVPIPTALPLLAGGLSMLGLFGWRRKQRIAV